MLTCPLKDVWWGHNENKKKELCIMEKKEIVELTRGKSWTSKIEKRSPKWEEKSAIDPSKAMEIVWQDCIEKN